MHWQAAIKTSALLSSYGDWDPSPGVLSNFGCFPPRFRSSPTFYLFSFLPHLPFRRSSAPFFSPLSLRLHAALLLLSNILCVVSGPVRQDMATAWGGGRPKTVREHMYVPLTLLVERIVRAGVETETMLEQTESD